MKKQYFLKQERRNKNKKPAHNKRYMLTALFGRFEFRKTPFGIHPLWYFTPPHFASAGIASQALIHNCKTSYI